MAAGLPVVASAAGGLPELVIPGVTGWLVPPDDPAALAAALDAAARLARTDPVAFAALGAAGRARVLARHSVPAMLAGVRAVYDRVAGFSG